MKKYTKKQILNTIAYWQKQLKRMNESVNSNEFVLELKFIKADSFSKFSVGDTLSVPINIMDFIREYTPRNDSELIWYLNVHVNDYIESTGMKFNRRTHNVESSEYKILNFKQFEQAFKDAGGWNKLDFKNMTVNDIPDNLSLEDGVYFCRKLADARKSREIDDNKFKAFKSKIINTLVNGLLKTKSIDTLANEWFKDYGTSNGWGWKTHLMYAIAAKLHNIHAQKYPNKHTQILPHKYGTGFTRYSEECSCGFGCDMDSSG